MPRSVQEVISDVKGDKRAAKRRKIQEGEEAGECFQWLITKLGENLTRILSRFDTPLPPLYEVRDFIAQCSYYPVFIHINLRIQFKCNSGNLISMDLVTAAKTTYVLIILQKRNLCRRLLTDPNMIR